MATQAQVLTSVRDRLDEASASFWTEAQLRAWINEGARDLCRRTESNQTTANVTAVAGTQQYTLPTDVIRVYRVEYIPTGSTQIYPLEYSDLNNLDAIWWTQQAVTQSTPILFTMWGYPPTLKLIVYPTPSVGGVFKIYYYALPAALATATNADAATTVPVPSGWEDCVVDYVEYMALRKDRDPRWQEAKGLYEEHVRELMDLSRRWTDQAGAVTPNAPLIPAWLYNDGW